MLHCIPILFFVLALTFCDAQNTTYEVRILEGLPTADLTTRGISPATLVIRHNLQGKITFKESSRYWIEMRIQVPEGRNTSEIQTAYGLGRDNETIILQVDDMLLRPDPMTNEAKDQLVLIIGASLGGFFVVCITVSLFIYFCWWKPIHSQKEQGLISTEHQGDNATEGSVFRETTFAQRRRIFSDSSVAVAIVTFIATACVVHAQLVSPMVDITVYTPHGFLRDDSMVLVRADHRNPVEVNASISISVYDVPSAAQFLSDHCDVNVTCHMGTCDPLTGKCACPREKKLLTPGRDRCVYACESSCPSGTFEASPCNETQSAVCRKCRPLCSYNEFESAACAGTTDRNCTDISQLPQIKVSQHLMYEDLFKVKHDINTEPPVTNISGPYDVWLNRTSGIALRVRLISMDLSTSFRQVHHHSNDNTRFQDLSDFKKILDDFCEYPLPDFYIASISHFQEIDVRKDDYYNDCPTYPKSESKRKAKVDDALFCPGVNNSVVPLFGSRTLSDKLRKVEKSADCHRKKLACGKCREACAKHVRSIPGCDIKTRFDVTLGKQNYSEHYAYCFDCCFVDNCTCTSCPCGMYEKNCLDSQITCVRADEYKISLEPSFPSSGDFRCHVEVVKGPQFVLQTSLWKHGEMVYGVAGDMKNLTKESNEESTHDFGYLIFHHPTAFHGKDTKKDLIISGNVNRESFDVGWFSHDKDLTNSIASGSERNSLHLQPRRPFRINTKTWPSTHCASKPKGDFVLVANTSVHKNFEKFANLYAELDWQDRQRVYKVYDKSSYRKVSFRVPKECSILREILPSTTILNDASLQGALVSNRTFWTLMVKGWLKECPGAFNIKMYDQDRPKVEVYNYDIAVTKSKCDFLVEFNLPSGADTNLIDKQFMIKLTDTHRSIQIVLVSPRYAPNFNLPEIDSEIDIDHIAHLLLPFAYALVVMVTLLVGILIYGYRTRPKDRSHRDRDSKLHFRHVLFVVWHVGMRLVKSFLLTLTLLVVVLSAVHHSNVKVLERYPEFRAQRNGIERELMERMESHKAQEIDRQLRHLEKGKETCDQKLDEADKMIDAYFREMQRRLMEDIKNKSIIHAAFKSVERRFKEAKRNFRDTREEFNRGLRVLTDEINEKVQKIQNKIQGTFWMSAAKVMYDIIDAASRIFGGGLGPFINWVSLDVSFPRIDVSLGSFDAFFDDFTKSFNKPDLDFDVINYNFSGFHVNLPKKSMSLNLEELEIPEFKFFSPVTGERIEELLVLEWIASLFKTGIISGILLVMDFLWFVYRHCKTYQSALLLLHGIPVVYNLDDIIEDNEKKRKETEKKKLKESIESFDTSVESIGSNSTGSPGRSVTSTEQDKSDKQRKITQISNGQEDKELRTGSQGRGDEDFCGDEVDGQSEVREHGMRAVSYGMMALGYLNDAAFFVFRQLKVLNYQLTKTNLVPMCLLGVIGMLSIYVVIVTAKYSLNVESLDALGYFEVKMAPIMTMRKIVNTRITSNAFLINEIQLPYYEKRLSARVAFARKKAEFFQGFQCTTADLHNKEYCFWVDGKCDRVKPYTEQFLQNLTKLECSVPAVIPKRFTKFDRILYKQQMMRGVDPYVTACRSLVLNTFYTLLVIIAIFVIITLIGEVLMVVLKRFDLIRTVKTYRVGAAITREQEKDPDGVQSVGRLKIPEMFKEGDDQVDNKEGWTLQWLPEVAKTLNSTNNKKENVEKKRKDKFGSDVIELEHQTHKGKRKKEKDECMDTQV
ncbi:uncharacterized protein LOC116617592 isoform X2 [Nematostella vectensis]|nr:uncharacterized protein LOC116617592 isoform X2 [Nematostella vectensis]